MPGRAPGDRAPQQNVGPLSGACCAAGPTGEQEQSSPALVQNSFAAIVAITPGSALPG